MQETKTLNRKARRAAAKKAEKNASQTKMAWRASKDLRPGDRVITKDGRIGTVKAVNAAPGLHTVHNFAVEDHHTYFVGDGPGVWVHNTYKASTEAARDAIEDASANPSKEIKTADGRSLIKDPKKLSEAIKLVDDVIKGETDADVKRSLVLKDTVLKGILKDYSAISDNPLALLNHTMGLLGVSSSDTLTKIDTSISSQITSEDRGKAIINNPDLASMLTEFSNYTTDPVGMLVNLMGVIDAEPPQSTSIVTQLDKGNRTDTNGIILHSTVTRSTKATIAAFKRGVGTQLVVDKDGEIVKTSDLDDITYHVGKIKARDSSTSYTKKSGEKWGTYFSRIHKAESAKAFPSRFPTNNDSIGIEFVRDYINSSKTWDTITTKQKVAGRWQLKT